MAESVKTQKMAEKTLDDIAEKLTATIGNIGAEQKTRLDSLDNKQATHIKVMEDHAKLLEGWLSVFMQKSGVPISEIKPHKTLDDSLELAALRKRVALLEQGVTLHGN
ncbi:MAG: hypothetical protein KAQ85_00810 [Thermodesulfovibrionia bacterium]|nr:hypothetical protein [Thermodesulfovibrionia bacterium]